MRITTLVALHALLAAICDNVDLHFGSDHRAEQAQFELPLLSFFARTDCCNTTSTLALIIVLSKLNANCQSFSPSIRMYFHIERCCI